MVQQIVKFLYTITVRDLKFLIVGIIIGGLLLLVLRNIQGLKIILKKPTECILTFFITAVVFLQIFDPSTINSMAPIVLNFISTMAFSWIMTRYSVKNDYENKQKELAALSYKHSIGIRNKLKYTKEEIEKYIKELDMCSQSANECKLKSKLENTKSQIMYAYQDAIDNLNDWANTISEEIKIFEEVSQLDIKIEQAENDIDELSAKKQNTYEAKRNLKKLTSDKRRLLLSTNAKIFHAVKVANKEDALHNQNSIKEKVTILNKRKNKTESTFGA